MRLGSQIDAVASRLETAIRMQTVSSVMGQTVKGMASVMKTMETDKISKTMEAFEKSFEDMDVKSSKFYFTSNIKNTLTCMHYSSF